MLNALKRLDAAPSWLLALIAIIAAALLVFAPLPAANADELPVADETTLPAEPAAPVDPPADTTDPAPAIVEEAPAALVTVAVDVDYVTIGWYATKGDIWNPAQTLAFTQYTDEPDLNALDDEIAALAATCGPDLYLQIDVNVDDAEVAATIAGGVLYGPDNPGENLIPGGEGTAWKFVDVDRDVCAIDCTSSGAWGTEADDTAPVQTDEGLVFTGGTGKAVGYGTAITGNLQGLGEINVAASGDLDVFYTRIVINSLADGGYAYDSLTVISEGPVNGSSIAASNKRGFVQHTLDEWAALLPGNQLVAIFLHLDSGATADQTVTVTGVTGDCLNLDTVPEPETPEEPTPPATVKAGDFQPSPLLAPLAMLLLAALAAGGAARTRTQK